MTRLTCASARQIDAITRESYVLWGGGLTFKAYRDLWEEMADTEWCRRHARYRVWEDADGRVLSSMKVYRPRLRLIDQIGRCSVFGAVFTPRAQRRRGHASDMVAAGVEESRRRGDIAVMLFSDIGTGFYQHLGFRALPAFEHVGRLGGAGPNGQDLGLRPARWEELDLIRQAHDATSASRPVAVLRDRAQWEFLWLRSHSFFNRVHGVGVRHEWLVAHRGSEFVGYAIVVEGRGEWNLREVGSVRGDVATMADILRRAAHDAYRRGCRRVYGWFPDEIAAALGDWGIRGRSRRRAIPMLRADPSTPGLEGCFVSSATHIPFQDQF